MATPLVIPYRIEPRSSTPAFPDRTHVARPSVLTTLDYRRRSLPFSFYSVIDSGADYCIFPTKYGERIGISVRDGDQHRAQGVTAAGTVYFHDVKVWVSIGRRRYWFKCRAGFMYSLQSIGLLGRHGFFELFESVTFYHHDQKVKLIMKPPRQASGP